MDKSFDVVVIGASLSGTSAALSFRKTGHSVLILDKSRFPRQKVCGEFLSPSLWPWFEEMGLKEKILQSGFHSVNQALLYSPKGQCIEIRFEEPALGISRYVLDQLLLDEAKEQGAFVEEGSLVTEKYPQNGGWTLKAVKMEGKTGQVFHAKKLVDASGKPAVSNMKVKNEMLGFQAHFENVGDLEHLELYFFQEGYGGIVKIEDGLVNACFLLKKKDIPLHMIPMRPAKFMNWVFERHPVLKARMNNAALKGILSATGPLSYGLRVDQTKEENMFYVGDALGVIDPFFGQGMTIAFQTGWKAGQYSNSCEFFEWARKTMKKRFLLASLLRKSARFSGLMEGVFSVLQKSRPASQFIFKMAHGYL